MGREEGYWCEVEIEVESPYSTALAEALEPDNTPSPPWLSVRCETSGSKLTCRVRVECSDPSRLLSLRNTVDDLLVSLKSAIDALRGLEPTTYKA